MGAGVPGILNGREVNVLQTSACLLGNDLAGDKVIVNPLVTDTPCIYQPQDPVEIEVPNLYPACAVTRAMKRKEQENNFDINLEDTFMANDDSQDDTPVIDIANDDPTQFIKTTRK